MTGPVPPAVSRLRSISSRATLPSCLSRSISGPDASGGTSATIVAESWLASCFFSSAWMIRPLASSIALIASARPFSTSSVSTPICTFSTSAACVGVLMSRSNSVMFSVESETRFA